MGEATSSEAVAGEAQVLVAAHVCEPSMVKGWINDESTLYPGFQYGSFCGAAVDSLAAEKPDVPVSQALARLVFELLPVMQCELHGNIIVEALPSLVLITIRAQLGK